MSVQIKIFSTRECHRCKKLAAFLEKNGFSVDFLNVDDPENETDTIMYDIMAVPAIIKGTAILKMRDIFKDSINEIIDEGRVLSFVKGS